MSLQSSEPKLQPAPDSVTTGPIGGSRKVYAAPASHPGLRVPFREIVLSDPKEPPVRVYDPSGPYTDTDARIDLRQGLPAIREGWIARPGLRCRRGTRPPPRGQRQLCRGPDRRGLPGAAHPPGRPRRPDGDAIRVRPRRHHHGRDGLCGASREPRTRGSPCGRHDASRRWREFRGRAPRVRYPGVRASRDRARPRHHPVQHQPSRSGAHGDRAQLPGQGQCQYRQLGRDVGGGRGGREARLGDPLGRRHGHGSLDRPQHPQYPLLDRPQRAGTDRHGADLPGFGEGRRRPGQARLGGVQGHADRTGRTGRRLLSRSTPACGSPMCR